MGMINMIVLPVPCIKWQAGQYLFIKGATIINIGVLI
jgi:hypothetical protein